MENKTRIVILSARGMAGKKITIGISLLRIDTPFGKEEDGGEK